MRLRRTLLVSHIDSDLKGSGDWYEDESEDEELELLPVTGQSFVPETTREAIVFGETWHKLAFTCTLSSDRAGVTEHLKPNQLSVGVASAVETIIHSSRKWVHDHTNDADAVFLERDCENAFNGADPNEFL